jgi:hypothetical protein
MNEGNHTGGNPHESSDLPCQFTRRWRVVFVPERMDDRMVVMEPSEGGGIASRVKCLVKRCDIGCLPPPGGAQAATSVVSSISFQNNFLRS